MSLFKAVTAFKLKEEYVNHFDDVDKWLEPQSCEPVGTQWSRMGVDSIANEGDFQLITIIKGERILPRGTIIRAVLEKLKDIPKDEQTRKVKAEFTAEFVKEHLPVAPIKVTEVPCGIYKGWFFVGSSSTKLVDDVINYLRREASFGLERFEDTVGEFDPLMFALMTHDVDGLVRFDDRNVVLVGTERRKITISDPSGAVDQSKIEDLTNGYAFKPSSLTCVMNDDGSTVATFKLLDTGVITGLKTVFAHGAGADEKEEAASLWGQMQEVYHIYSELANMGKGVQTDERND